MASQIIAVAVFVAVIAVIISDKIHRAACALIGSLILILLGILEPGEALDYIDFNTLGVLMGMMMFVGVIRNSGFFEYLAIRTAKAAGGDPWKIMVYFMIITAVLSSFLDNVTTVLLIGPMTFIICRKLELNPVPYLLTQIIASNLGGTATLIGDPPNIMIGSAADISFMQFLFYDGTIVLISMAAAVVFFRVLYRKGLQVPRSRMDEILLLDEKEEIRDVVLFRKSIFMVFVVAAAFIFHDVLGIQAQGVDVWPLWWAVSIGACFGGNGTIIGASANVVLTGISARRGYPIAFMDFLKVGAPVMLLSILLASGYLLILFGGYWN